MILETLVNELLAEHTEFSVETIANGILLFVYEDQFYGKTLAEAIIAWKETQI